MIRRGHKIKQAEEVQIEITIKKDYPVENELRECLFIKEIKLGFYVNHENKSMT